MDRRLPSTINYRFEKVGNFVYVLAPIELEISVGYGRITNCLPFQFLVVEADASPIHGGTPYQNLVQASHEYH